MGEINEAMKIAFLDEHFWNILIWSCALAFSIMLGVVWDLYTVTDDDKVAMVALPTMVTGLCVLFMWWIPVLLLITIIVTAIVSTVRIYMRKRREKHRRIID